MFGDILLILKLVGLIVVLGYTFRFMQIHPVLWAVLFLFIVWFFMFENVYFFILVMFILLMGKYYLAHRPLFETTASIGHAFMDVQFQLHQLYQDYAHSRSLAQNRELLRKVLREMRE